MTPGAGMESGAITLTPSGAGLLLLVLAKPKSSRNALLGVHDGRLKAAVTAAPEKGKANAAVLNLLAKALGLKRSQLSLAAGDTDPRKAVLVAGVTADDLSARIASALRG